MNERSAFEDLKARAEEILNSKASPAIPSNPDVKQIIRDLKIHQIALELQNEDLMRSQSEIEESSNKYYDLYELAPVGYFTLDTNCSILHVNQAAADLLGVSKEELLHRSFVDYILPEFHYIFSNYHEQFSHYTSVQKCELKIKKPGGMDLYVQLEGSSLIHPSTREKHLLIMVTDITNKRVDNVWTHQHRQKIAYVERVNSMSELAKTIAYELNQPLAVIANYINGCVRRIENGKCSTGALRLAMEQASVQLGRATEMVLRMKNFMCREILYFESCHLDEVIRESIGLMKLEIKGTSIEILYRPLPSLSSIRMDKIHIQQVMLNLAWNAFDAMQDANTNEPKLIIEVSQPKLGIVEIRLQDNGPGFDKDYVHKLFDPYYTTKPYGMGLGLAMCRTIVEAHGGKLIAELNPTIGTTFKFTLQIQP